MYKLFQTRTEEVVLRANEDGSTTSFPKSELNTDYQEYLKWVAEGNTPLPADGE